MSQSYAPKGSERSSFAHQDERLRRQNPLYDRTEPITRNFEKERCELNAKVLAQEGMSEAERRHDASNDKKAEARRSRRQSFMAKRSQPKLILQPPRHVSYAANHAAHNADAERDHAEALKDGEAKPEASMMMKVFKKSRKKAFIEKRLQQEGFDLKRQYRRSTQAHER